MGNRFHHSSIWALFLSCFILLTVNATPTSAPITMHKTPVFMKKAPSAKNTSPPSMSAKNTPPPSIETKAGYFFFTSSTMRRVYTHGGIDVQLAGTCPFSSVCSQSWCSWFRLYGSIEYLSRSGFSLQEHQKTSIWEIPVSLGCQPIFCLSSHPKIYCYLTFGPRYIFAHTHNRSSYVPHVLNANGIGLFANGGFLFSILPHLFFDIFAEYTYAKLDFHSNRAGAIGHTVQLSGVTSGGGLGYAF